MKLAHGLLSSLLLACSAGTLPSSGTSNPTVETQCSDADKNAFGDCYPTSDIGTGARTSFSTSGAPGQRIANYAFTGFEPTDTSLVAPGSPQTIHLAHFFNPNLQTIPSAIGDAPVKLIHLTVAAVWCNPCNQETDFISGANFTGANTTGASFAKELAPLGVIFVQALSDGPTFGTGATLEDLSSWIGHHQSDFTEMLDPNVQNLGVFFDAAAVPFNMNIDARSMEILSSEVGFDIGMADDIKNRVLPWIDSHPAKQ
jgi:hypothetical protein